MAAARRFYSWVWRINGLMFLALAVGGAAMLVWAGASLFQPATRAHQGEIALQVEPGKVDTSGAQLGGFQTIPGTGLLQAALELPKGGGMLYSKGVAPIRNYYFFDPSSHDGHWLIPGYRGLIAETHEFPARHGRGEDNSAAEVVVYQLVDADSNGDGALNEADLMTLALADAKEGNFVRLLTKVQSFKGIHLVGKRTLSVIFTSEGQMRAAQVDLDTGKIVRQSVLKL